MRRMMTIAAVLIFVLATAGVSCASSLADLFQGGSITAGDKLFDNWSLQDYYTSDSARSFDAANIDVTALTDGGLDPGPGLSFAVSNGELSVTGDDIYAYVDLMFGFRVSVLDPLLGIKDNTLAYTNGGAMLKWDVDSSYDLGSYIYETVGTASGLDDLGTKNIEFSECADPTNAFCVPVAKITDSVAFAPQSEIWVTKNILVWAVDSTDTSALYGFDQRFSQAPVGAPEPGTLLLLSGGLVSLFAGRRMFGCRHGG